MTIEKSKLFEELEELKNELVNMPYWVTGSVIETTRKQAKKEKPFYYLSQSVKGKTKTTYISANHLDRFKNAVSEGEKVKEILGKINAINIQLIKSSMAK